MTDNPKNFDSLQERNEQVLNNISQLQKQEKDLYNSLDDVSLSSEQKRIIMDRINQISQIRMNLYTSLKDMFSYYKQNVDTSSTTLGESIAAVNILEDELKTWLELIYYTNKLFNEYLLINNLIINVNFFTLYSFDTVIENGFTVLVPYFDEHFI